MELKKAGEEDISRIMELIGQAKAFLWEKGVDQWQDGYPDRENIRGDIARGTGYLCTEAGKTVGYVCVDFDGEPAYEDLKGRWLSDRPYVVAHRMALDNAVKGKGLASQVFRLVEELARSKGIHSFKVDTDENNEIMRHLLEKNGFQYCGAIWFQNSDKIAFEKLI